MSGGRFAVCAASRCPRLLGNQYGTLTANHGLQGLYDLKVSTILCQPLVPMEVRPEERAHALDERGIPSPYIGVVGFFVIGSGGQQVTDTRQSR
jgi:hypothetical protein